MTNKESCAKTQKTIENMQSNEPQDELAGSSWGNGGNLNELLTPEVNYADMMRVNVSVIKENTQSRSVLL